MKISMPITKKRIQTHWHYAWWQYVLLVVVAIAGWSLMHTVTHYRSPAHLTVEWVFGGVTLDQGKMAEELMEELNQELLPEMEEVRFLHLLLDDQYSAMQLTTWAFAGEGDIYTLPTSYFQNLAASGAYADLQPYIDDGTLNVEGIDLSGGYVNVEAAGRSVLCGIPVSAVPGLERYGLLSSDSYFSLLITGGNLDNSAKLLGWILDNCREPVENSILAP
ncbi:MAG: hypothetical protein E7319_05640 [Clostridiales bacterium]|nr:hypothetical protein [Clostridiales bacterium]